MQWAASDDAKLYRLHSAGVTFSDMGGQLRGRSANACKKRAARLGLPFRRRWTAEEIAELDRLRALGLSWVEVARATGRSWSAVKSYASDNGRSRHIPKGRPWTASDDADLLNLYARDVSYVEMAAKLDRTAYACNTRMSARYLRRETPVEAPAPPDPDWAYRQLRAELKIGSTDD